MVQLATSVFGPFPASFSFVRFLFMVVIIMKQKLVMTSLSSNTQSSVLPQKFLCGSQHCNTVIGKAIVNVALTGVAGDLRSVALSEGEHVHILGRPISGASTLWLVQFGDKKGLVNGDFLKEDLANTEDSVPASNLLEGKNPFFVDETKLGEYSPNMLSPVKETIHRVETTAPSIDESTRNNLKAKRTDDEVTTVNTAESHPEDRRQESLNNEPSEPSSQSNGSSESVVPDSQTAKESSSVLPEPTTKTHQGTQEVNSTTVDHSSLKSDLEKTNSSDVKPLPQEMGREENGSNAKQALERDTSNVPSLNEESHIQVKANLSEENGHKDQFVNDSDNSQATVSDIHIDTETSLLSAAHNQSHSPEESIGENSVNREVSEKSIKSEELVNASSTGVQNEGKENSPQESHMSDLNPNSPSFEVRSHEESSHDDRTILTTKSEPLFKMSVQECWLYISQQSEFFSFAFQTVQSLKRPIRQMLAMLPNETAAMLEDDLSHYTHLNIESLALAIITGSFLMTVFTLARCGSVFRSDWRNVLSRQHDQITTVEDKLIEKDRLNASLTDWNASLTKQIKCYENEITHLKSLTITRDTRINKDLECSREQLTFMESEIQRLRLQVNSLEHHLSVANIEREEIVQRELEKSAVLSANHMAVIEEKDSLLQSKELELRDVLSERDDLREQLILHYQQLNELKQELADMKKGRQSWEASVSMKEAEIENLKRSFQELKMFDREIEELLILNKTEKSSKLKRDKEPSGWDLEDGGDMFEDVVTHDNHIKETPNVEDTFKDKLDSFFNCSKLRSNLQMESERVARLEDRLTAENENRKRLEERLEELEKEKLSLNEILRESEEQQAASKTRLEILSQYFKEREVEYLVSVGKEVVEKGNTAQEYVNEKLRREVLEEELIMLREHAKSLKQELAESSRQYRKQQLQLEKRAHENWLTARSFEREVKELKEENASLRQRFYENAPPVPKSFPALPGMFPPNLRMLGPPPYFPPFALPPMFLGGMNTAGSDSLGESAPPRPGSRHSIQSEFISPVDNTSDRDSERRQVPRSNSRGGSLPPPVLLPPPHLLIRPPRLPIFNATPPVHQNSSIPDVNYSGN